MSAMRQGSRHLWTLSRATGEDRSVLRIPNECVDLVRRYTALREHDPHPALLQKISARDRDVISTALVEFDPQGLALELVASGADEVKEPLSRNKAGVRRHARASSRRLRARRRRSPLAGN